MDVQKAKSVRFSILVEKFGKPTVYLPLSEPDNDPKFVEAVEENRVVTLKQEPTSKRKEFGVVGYLKEKFVTYLIFPKPLSGFEDDRVIGINYELLRDASLMPSPAPEIKAKKHVEKARRVEKPKPQPKEFRVKLRITATAEQEISVTAMNQREARAQAEQEVMKAPDLQEAKVTAKVLGIRQSD